MKRIFSLSMRSAAPVGSLPWLSVPISFRLLAAAGMFLFAAEGGAAEEGTEALKQRILAQARTVSPEDFAFTRTVHTEESDGSKTEQHVVIEKWDPTKAANERWTFVSRDGHTPTAEEMSNYRKGLANRRVPNYGRVAEYFASPATTTLDGKGRAVFSFATLPKGTLMVNDVDLSASTIAQSTVDASGGTPFVEHTRFTSTKATRVKLVAKIERMEATSRYRLMPNGKPAPVEGVTDMTGSMLGKSGRIRSVATYSEQRAVR